MTARQFVDAMTPVERRLARDGAELRRFQREAARFSRSSLYRPAPPIPASVDKARLLRHAIAVQKAWIAKHGGAKARAAGAGDAGDSVAGRGHAGVE